MVFIKMAGVKIGRVEPFGQLGYTAPIDQQQSKSFVSSCSFSGEIGHCRDQCLASFRYDDDEETKHFAGMERELLASVCHP